MIVNKTGTFHTSYLRLGKSKNKCINFTVNALLALEEKNTLKKISVYTGKQDVMFDSYW